MRPTDPSRRALLLALVAAACLPARAEEVRLAVTADVGICAHPREILLNNGAAARARIKGIQHYYLFDFDSRPVAGWKIESARLRLKIARGNLRRAAVCTVPVPWPEGSGRNQPVVGAACFTHAELPKRAWTRFGGTLLDATFNSPHSRWRSAEVREEDGWWEIPLDPALVEAVAAGLSYGLVLSDETGQTFENHDVCTREQAGAEPVVIVRGTPAEGPEPAAVAKVSARPFPEAAGFQSGAVAVNVQEALTLWKSVGCAVELDEDGSETIVRRATFADPEILFEGLTANRRYDVRAHLLRGGRVVALPPASVRASAALPMPRPEAAVTADLQDRVVAGQDGWCAALLSALGKIRPDASGAELLARRREVAGFPVPVTPRNAWAGVQVVVFAPDGPAGGLEVRVDPPQHVDGGPPLAVDLFRAIFVPKGRTWHEEILVPLRPGERWTIPRDASRLEKQSCQPIFVDVWVPADAASGQYRGALTLRRQGRELLTVPLRLTVAQAVLPDEFHIAGDCNTYGSPAGLLGGRRENPERYLELERRFYRLAHAHRLTLNVLPYSQSGQVAWRGAPEVTGTGDDSRIVDWSRWDARYGPLLTGEAFSAESGYLGPGTGTPVRHMYLPFHENWPSPLAEHFTPWPPPKGYQEFLQWSAELPPIEESLDAAYGRAWMTVLRQFARHLGRTYPPGATQFQVYLNNKHLFRNAERTAGRGISLWLLDEPMFADDFLALRYFARLTQRALGRAEPDGAEAEIDFRVDISRPTHQRDWLDGVVDLNVCADQLHAQRRLIRFRRLRFDETYWNYRDPESFGESNLPWALWPVRSYCWGAAGTLVWQTIGTNADLEAADPTALLYPGVAFGLDAPVPSLRLKAWREGLQTAELLRMLRRLRNWNDAQLRAWVGQVIALDGWQSAWDPPGESPIATFADVTVEDLDLLRRAAIAELGPATEQH